MTFYILKHPNLDSYIFSSKEKTTEFVIRNEDLWKKYNIDTRTFTVESAIVKDSKIYSGLMEARPELFL